MITLYATFEVYLPRYENMKGSAVIKQETQLLPMDSAMRSQLESFRMLHKIRQIPLVTIATDERPPRSFKIIRDWAKKRRNRLRDHDHAQLGDSQTSQS